MECIQTTVQPNNRLITMAYEDVIKKLEQIQIDINNSNHDRMGYEDYEADADEINACLKDFGLGEPEWNSREVTIPVEFWNEAFGETEDFEEIERIMESTEYKKLEEMYLNLFDQVVHIATEMSAYYANEYDQEQKYYDSMRGQL